MSVTGRRKFGPTAVLAVSALAVLSLSAFATAHNWLEFATGSVYRITSVTDQRPGSASTLSASPTAEETEGYDAGYEAGKKAGYKHGLNRGRNLGYKHGYAIGHRQGYKIGDASGYRAGYPIGLKAGHHAGVRKQEAQLAAWKAAMGGTGG